MRLAHGAARRVGGRVPGGRLELGRPRPIDERPLPLAIPRPDGRDPFLFRDHRNDRGLLSPWPAAWLRQPDRSEKDFYARCGIDAILSGPTTATTLASTMGQVTILRPACLPARHSSAPPPSPSPRSTDSSINGPRGRLPPPMSAIATPPRPRHRWCRWPRLSLRGSGRAPRST